MTGALDLTNAIKVRGIRAKHQKAFLAAFSSAQTFSFGRCPTTHTQTTFDIKRYMGDWYEIYRFPTGFETGSKCVKANYLLQSNNHVRVFNEGINTKTGNHSSATGDAFQGDPVNTPAALKIRFSDYTPYGNYWVLKTDYITYTLVYSCTNILGISHLEFAWILARQRTLPQATVDELFQVFTDFKININHFIKTDQTNC